MTKRDSRFQSVPCLEDVRLIASVGDDVVMLGLPLPETAVMEAKELFKHFVNKMVTSKEVDFVNTEPELSEVVVGARFIGYAANLPTTSIETMSALFAAFNAKFCSTQNIHASICDQSLSEDLVQLVLQSYYAAQEMCIDGEKQQQPMPALFSSAAIRPVGIFRGQGGMDNYIDETRTVYRTYRPLVGDFVEQMNAFLVEESADPDVSSLYRHGLDVLSWITNSDDALPNTEYLLSVPVSIPVVGLTQLMQVVVLYKTLGITPGELAKSFKEFAGHSQGISTATALSMATDESSFYGIAKRVLGLLMITGVFPQLDYPFSIEMPGLAATDGTVQRPTSMVCVLKLTQEQLQRVIDQHNKQQREAAMYVYISLVNGAHFFVVSGVTSSVAQLVRRLGTTYDAKGTDQSRTNFSQRKPRVVTSYISINAPYHCRLLAHAAERAQKYAARKGWQLDAGEMRRAVRANDDGHDIRTEANLTHYLLESMCVLPVNWPLAVRSTGATHVVDFGPGGAAGFGDINFRILEGRGVPLICASVFSHGSSSKRSPVAPKADMYKADAADLGEACDWQRNFAPRLVRTEADGKIHIDTPMSRLLGKPPVMVAGMTPSTISDVFVSAVMRAGYHIELSGGGHFSEPMLRDKVDKILKSVDPGLGISINSIYVNPFLWNIQYPAIQRMRREGIPMEGLCIGAGVPSYEVCNEIITSICAAGFRHIGLKPSSVSTIRLVIKIAQANPDFPILLQWTGGRAGGHHSFEDFHQPILETYGAVRAQKNIVLVAGSGFGGVDDTLPYLTGEWSKRFDCAPMPFDGCLFASRVMVAKEGCASDSVKEAIVAAPGIDDSEWEKTYKSPAGGIVTVLSELGEPIHKIATRGVMFWKEMDDTVFSLPRDKRLPVLLAKKEYIINRLNADFQKPWFGQKADGSNADLEEMTYAEVANRLLGVLYIKHQSRWIDVTMRNLVGDYLLRLEERFIAKESPATLQSFNQINDPFDQVKAILDLYPDCYTQLLTSEDIQFFINLCMRPGQKPVPFIPVMDKDFHIWFKKDSLWQAEDVDAVADQDVGRVCILQGPVAARYSTKANEPVKDILDNIYNGQIASLLERYYDGDESKVPTVGYMGNALAACPALPHVGVETTETKRIYTLPKSKVQLPETEAWLEILAGNEMTWLRAFLTTPIVVQNHKYESNIAQRVLHPRSSQVVKVALDNSGRPKAVEVIDTSGYKALDFSIDGDNVIHFNMYSSPRGTTCTLELLFRYQARMPYAPIHEVMEGRNERIKRFYAQMWFENSEDGERLIHETGYGIMHCGEQITIDRDDVNAFCSAVGSLSSRYIAPWDCEGAHTPLDFAMRVFWPALCKCLMTQTCDGDLTRMVHLSNGFRVLLGARDGLRAGQTVSSEACITSVRDTSAGRNITVQGAVTVGGRPVVEVNTVFLFRGQTPEFATNFTHTREQPILLTLDRKSMVALLKAKEWFVPRPGANDCTRLGSTLRFNLESQYRFSSAAAYSNIVSFGPVYARSRCGKWEHVADVDYESGATHRNGAMQFLQSHGRVDGVVQRSLNGKRKIVTDGQAGATAPASGREYSCASADHNPIHTSKYFADLVGLPGPIAHGMWTSASTRTLVEDLVARGDPARMTAFSAAFVGMVRPGDRLETRVHHTGFADGRMVVAVETSCIGGARVLEARAEIEQPTTVFAFAGQGAHAPGMGMELYAQSAVARDVWDSADHFMRSAYGIPLLDIVRSNPRTLTVHFTGKRGAAVRARYRAMAYEHSKHDGSRLVSRPLFPEIAVDAESFTFSHARGLLYATQFTQSAMLVCEVAEFAHLESCGVVPAGALFAGHSLGEYAGLTAIGHVFSPETAADIGFCRGLTMQQAVRRDAASHASIYGMVAVNPTRVAAWFTPESLVQAVRAIRQHGGYDGLLEIVNYNVQGTQYVVSGELVLLEALGQFLDSLQVEHAVAEEVMAQLAASAVSNACMLKEKEGPHFELCRTHATIPVPGVDVPFHSSLLHDGVWSFRKMLRSKIQPHDVEVERLRGRYVPNLTARPFDVTLAYIRHVYELTHSEALAGLLTTLEVARLERDAEYFRETAYTLLIEVLSYQFSSPVRWIETQDALLRDLGVTRFIEIGPRSVLSNMLRHTLDCSLYKLEGCSDSLKSNIEILSSASDMDAILYENASAELSQTAAPDKMPEETVAPEDSYQPASGPAVASSVNTRAKDIDDVAIQPLEVIQALVAHKLKLRIEAVDSTLAIKDFVGGKSTLQNEIIGDLQKEFGDGLPEKPEEVPLAEFSQSLAPLTDSLGKQSLGLIARMVSSKMPGGFTKAQMCQYLKTRYGLGPLRQQGVLLVALSTEPASRLGSNEGAWEWLASAAGIYAKRAGITFQTQPLLEPSSSPVQGSSNGAVAVIDSKEFIAAQAAQKALARCTLQALAAYLGASCDPVAGNASQAHHHQPTAEAEDHEQPGVLAPDIDLLTAELGPEFLEQIRPTFTLLKARQFDSYWNWAKQDLVELYYNIIQGKITKVDLSLMPNCLRLANRFTPAVVRMLCYLVRCSTNETSAGHALAHKYGTSLVNQYVSQGEGALPAYQFTQQLLMPCLGIDDSGNSKYTETARPGEKSIHDYVRAITSDSHGFAKPRSSLDAANALNVALKKLELSESGTAQRQNADLPPMVHLRRRVFNPVTGWEYDPDLSAQYAGALIDICNNGLTLSGKRALVVGCGEGSIGAEVLKGLLEGGAQVVATTSRYSASTMRYFQTLYQTHGSRGSSLTVVPFNQASRQDISALVKYIYGGTDRGKGLGWDLDYVMPFAAIPELGHDITELGSRSELAHRTMLTNTFRLLGEIAACKAGRRLDMHPTLAVLPLSPNHGAFGMDGLYSESKIGLETLMHRWHSETRWQPYLSVAGAVIGWTRGTGLMSANNIVADCVERAGVRTFSAGEMAFNILGLLHPAMYELAAQGPVWADMAGRFQFYPEITRSIGDRRWALGEMDRILKATTAEALKDFGDTADEDAERVYKLRKAKVLCNHQFKFPVVKEYTQLGSLRHLQDMVNLDKVVVITGYGEVGPYGNAETRWEMEAYGEFSLEACVELAWIMGLVRHFNGKHKSVGKMYTGWVDAKTEEPVSDAQVKARYERQILEHTGIRLIEPEEMGGYDPNKKPMLRELQIEHAMEPFEATADEAAQFKLRNGDKVDIWENADSTWSVRLLKGATLMVPKALRFDRLVAAQLPTGWDPVRYGIPKEIVDQIDPVTCYALVATAEALVRSGITDPYELYRYVHVSEVGSATSSALGGQRSAKKVYLERMCDRDQQPDIYQESFLNTVPAWINMLLMSSSGPIKTTIGACATGIVSIEVAIDTIQSGKARVMLAGGSDDFSEESSYEFAQMNATSNAVSERLHGRTPREMSRPCTTTRNGFMEGEGAGIVTLMAASTALEIGAPIYGIVAMTNTATDKEGRSVPAPGKGILTSAREILHTGVAPQQLLDIGYRRRQLDLRMAQINEWTLNEQKLATDEFRANSQSTADVGFKTHSHTFVSSGECAGGVRQANRPDAAAVLKERLELIEITSQRQHSEALDTWGNDFWKRNPYIAPLRGALAVWGLTVDDIGVASFHGTSTKANDKNESEIIEQQFRHLGRTPGNAVLSVCQKYLTGHPKGPASIWMLNGLLQSLRTGLIPGNRNADNIASELEQCEYIVYPSRPIQTTGIKAGLLKSFGFGQVGAECLVVHPDYLLATLTQDQLEQYRHKVSKREARAYRYWHNVLVGAHPLVQVKEKPPYTDDQEEELYLNPLQRLSFGDKI
ncbi:fatty acid synthase alpha subunit Lsd1 [Coemansia sp. RSA 1843]|nr:fatty acid synthase alpha subunit Lsd1 [Coemansia sp. RSA 1843]